MAIKMKYKDVGGFKFFNLINKISTTPTSNKNACHIHQIVKRVNENREAMIKAYDKELTQVFAKKDEAGKLIVPEDDPSGFSIIEGKEEEFKKAQDAFGEREFVVEFRPWTPETLADVKLSGEEIGLLGELFTEAPQGPALPEIKGMPGMGREVRRAEHRV